MPQKPAVALADLEELCQRTPEDKMFGMLGGQGVRSLHNVVCTNSQHFFTTVIKLNSDLVCTQSLIPRVIAELVRIRVSWFGCRCSATNKVWLSQLKINLPLNAFAVKSSSPFFFFT